MSAPMTPEREAELREYAESFATDYERPALLEALDAMAFERARADAADARYLEVAHALGLTYDADGHAQSPAPHSVILDGVRELAKPHPLSKKRKCEHCGRMTRVTTAGCDHCDVEGK